MCVHRKRDESYGKCGAYAIEKLSSHDHLKFRCRKTGKKDKIYYI